MRAFNSLKRKDVLDVVEYYCELGNFTESIPLDLRRILVRIRYFEFGVGGWGGGGRRNDEEEQSPL
jgi:hypothetical protein